MFLPLFLLSAPALIPLAIVAGAAFAILALLGVVVGALVLGPFMLVQQDWRRAH